MGLKHKLHDLYARLPRINCKGLCQECCGPIVISLKEAEILERKSGKVLEFDAVTGKCTYLNSEGKCEVYNDRPFVCRLWGTTPHMRCPFGCKPEWEISQGDAAFLLAKTIDLGMGPYGSMPTNWVEFEKHHSYHKQIKGRTIQFGPLGKREEKK